MEIEFDKEPKKGGTPKTRLYAPGKGPKKRGSAGKGGRDPGEVFQDEDGFRVRVSKDEINPLSRLGMILCGFIFAGMVIFMLTGYEKITRAYADINILNDEIDQTNLRITELDVQIECAVTIQDAQEAAERFGMQYPSQSQYVKTGDYIPISGSAPVANTVAGTMPGEAAPADTATGSGAPAAPEATTAPVEYEVPDASADVAN